MATLQEYREQREHVSFSSVNQYLGCSLQWSYARLYKITPAFTPVALAYGSALHRSLEYINLRRKNHEKVEKSVACDLFMDLWQRQLQEDQNVRFDEEITQETCAVQGAEIIRCYLNNMDPEENVLNVNEAFCVSIIDSSGSALEKPLVGELDAVVSKGDKTVVVDWKSSGKRWGKDKCHKDLQPTAFLYAFNQVHGIIPEFRFDVLIKNKTVVMETHYTRRCPDDFHRLVELIKVMEAAVKAELFFPNQSSFHCTNCQFQTACKAWHRNRNKLISLAA